ncbi:MAG: ABC transporter permease [Chloroflexi bacterium]|nr:ABC transporter permease [Chloroflexota bacterium]
MKKSSLISIIPFIKMVALLVGANLVAVQTRLKYTYGKPLGDDYQAHPISLYILMLFSILVANFIIWIVIRVGLKLTVAIRQLIILWLATGILVGLATLFIPTLSQLQLGYFAAAALLFSPCITVIPALWRGSDGEPVSVHLAKLWNYRVLLIIWLRFNVLSRYSQATLGIFWIILLPLSTSLVLAFVFSRFLRVGVTSEGVPFVTFFLAALVPWTLFQQGITKGSTSVFSQIGLINQVYFPREILVLITLGEALVDVFFMFLAMLVINGVSGVWPNWLYIYLPMLILIQALFMAGLMLFLGSLSVIVRDIPQLIGVLMQLLFYLSPILYPASLIPHRYRFILAINPLVPLFQAYRDIIVYAQTPDFATLYFPLVVSVIVLFMGYVYFKSREDGFADRL